MLAVATGLVLLMACANVAGLLLARGIARRRELAIRGALGAGSDRIVRQLLTESFVLSLADGALGLAVTAAIMRAAPAMVPRRVPGLDQVGVDGTVLAFAAALSIGAGLLFGAAPARAPSWPRTLNEASAPAAGGFWRLRANIGQAVLATGQVALALVLLTAAGLLLRSFVALVTFDLGFDPHNVVIASAADPARINMFPRGGGRLDPEQIEAMNADERRTTETLLLQMERVTSLPGVEAVALASVMPFGEIGARPITVAGQPAPTAPREQTAGRDTNRQSRLRRRRQAPVAGRPLLHRSRRRRPHRASRSSANRSPGRPSAASSRSGSAWPSRPSRFWVRDATTTVAMRRPGKSSAWWLTSILPRARIASFMPNTAGDVYLSMLQPGMDRMPFFRQPLVVVRTAGDPLAVVPFLRKILTDASPGALVNATPLESFLEAQAAQPRFYALCAGTFAAVALLLAAFGLYKPAQLYGVATPARDRRPHGLGSRTPSRPHARIPAGRRARRRRRGLWDCSLPPPTNRIVESILFGVTPADPLTFAAVTAVLVVVGLVACWLPARRATRIDPMNVLHEV